jgi:hypothetical protein
MIISVLLALVICKLNTPLLAKEKPHLLVGLFALAGATGLEPATSDVTGRRSNQLNYAPDISLGVMSSECRVNLKKIPIKNSLNSQFRTKHP